MIQQTLLKPSCSSISTPPLKTSSTHCSYRASWGLRIVGSSSSSTTDSKSRNGAFTGRDPNVKKPAWLRQRAAQGERFEEVKQSLSQLNLNTVCQEAQCPNIGEVPRMKRYETSLYLLSLFYRSVILWASRLMILL